MLSKKLKERKRRRSKAELDRNDRAFGASLFGDQLRRAARRKEESGGEKVSATAGTAGRDAVSPSSDLFDGGRGSRERAA